VWSCRGIPSRKCVGGEPSGVHVEQPLRKPSIIILTLICLFAPVPPPVSMHIAILMISSTFMLQHYFDVRTVFLCSAIFVHFPDWGQLVPMFPMEEIRSGRASMPRGRARLVVCQQHCNLEDCKIVDSSSTRIFFTHSTSIANSGINATSTYHGRSV
jgi:hypothetical protein